MRDYKGVDVYVGEDGRKNFVFTQSWLSTYQTCPEQARFELVGEMPRHEWDYFSTGTSAHAAFEYVLDTIRDDGMTPPVEDAVEVALLTWADLLPEVEWAKYTADTAPEFIAATVKTWYAEVLPRLGEPIGCEIRFNEQLYEDTEKVIRLQGSIDHANWHVADVDGPALVDWKTASDPWRDTWRLKRHGIQSTAYTYAWHKRTGDTLPFHYYVLLADGTVQTLTCHRDQRHWDWLKMQCLQIVQMIDANLTAWPMLDQAKDGWGCSPKHCAAWDTCRGLHLGNTPW